MKFWLLTAITYLALSINPALAGVAVIVNKGNPIDEIEKHDLEDLYMGRHLYFPNRHQAVRLDLPPNSTIRQQFYRKLVNRSVAEVNAYWARLLFTGLASPPQVLQSTTEVIEFVRKHENAIGYVDSAQLEGSASSVKVLTVFE